MIEFYDMNGNHIEREEWIALIGDEMKRRVGYTRVPQTNGGMVIVSTVWLGISSALETPPRIFETLVFGGTHDGFMARYATRSEALRGHENTVVLVGGKREESCPTQKPLFSDP